MCLYEGSKGEKEMGDQYNGVCLSSLAEWCMDCIIISMLKIYINTITTNLSHQKLKIVFMKLNIIAIFLRYLTKFFSLDTYFKIFFVQDYLSFFFRFNAFTNDFALHLRGCSTYIFCSYETNISLNLSAGIRN